MTHGPSHIPPSGGKTSSSMATGGSLEGGDISAAKELRSGQGSVTADQFSQTAVSELLEEMKRSVTRQAEGQFDPARLVQRARQSPTVKPEELRAEVRQAQSQQLSRELSSFEKIFLEFFMGLRQLGRLLKKGQKKFCKKKKDEWRDFFERLFPYTKERSVASTEIRELIFRGLSEDDPRLVSQAATATGVVLVADVIFESGRTDKFARLPLSVNGTIALLQQMQPGEKIVRDQLLQWFGSGAVEYLSLYYKQVRPPLPAHVGSELTQGLLRQADAAARACEAMMRGPMGISSRAATLAAEGVRRDTQDSESERAGYAGTIDADRHSQFKDLFRKR